MPVHRLLVTGDDSQIMNFHLPLCMHLNLVASRGRTYCYTCMAEHLELALAWAEEADVTVQEIHGAGDSETYQLLHGDPARAWKRPQRPTPSEPTSRREA